MTQIMRNVLLFLALAGFARAQNPAGAIAGVVRDPSGGAVAGARVKLLERDTGMTRVVETSAQGDYSFPALIAGQYQVSVEAAGFPRMVRQAAVESGVTTSTDFDLRLGDVKEAITVDAATPQIQYDAHTVGGVITQDTIQNLPLNGRNFLELAKLEPGVQPPSYASSHRAFLPVLGSPGGGNSGNGTRIVVDGGSAMAIGTAGSSLLLSQEAVQELRTEVNSFDISSGRTFSGAVNVSTRSGGNQLHGSGVYFFRDHKLAAYPALGRDPANPDPFFQRRQFGGSLGGPVRRDRVFFFASVERNEQRGVESRTLHGDFASFSGITPSPLYGDLFTLRLDARLSSAHTAFVRYSHDGSRGFAPATKGSNTYPSGWTRQPSWVDQGILGLTSIIRPTVVNDFRYSYFFTSGRQDAPREDDCPGCLGIGSPGIAVSGGSSTISVGQSSVQSTLARRFQLTDSLGWQHGAHRARAGVDWEHQRGGVVTLNNEPVSITLFSPDLVRSQNPLLPIPTSFNTLADILSLPLRTMTLGFGDPRVPQQNGGTVPHWNNLSLYAHDVWQIRPRLTLNYGLSWSIDRYFNYDLRKPALLAPLLGAGGLGPTRKNWKDFAPVLGLAWSPGASGKTVVRAGAGIYYDFLFDPGLDLERALFGPPGVGRQTVPGSAIPIPVCGSLVLPGTLNFTNPTAYTGACLMSALAAIRADQLRLYSAPYDPSVTNFEINKTGSVNPERVPSWYSIQSNVGVQRQIAAGFVISADFAHRHYVHGPLNVDMNHFNAPAGPAIPQCSAAQRNDPHALCSNGAISIQQSAARQTYNGLLVRADKRLSRRYQLLASWAWSRNTSAQNINRNNWFKNVGPTSFDLTHILNVSGMVHLPASFDLGLNFSYSSALPLTATVSGIDLDGDGVPGDLLPGTTPGNFNRGLGRSDLIRLVNQFNQTYAGTKDAGGRPIPVLKLPSDFALGNDFQALDVRLSRWFTLREGWRLSLAAEGFNLYNKANLTNYSGALSAASGSFGQPTNRYTQIFGSGGPRAFQLAMIFRF